MAAYSATALAFAVTSLLDLGIEEGHVRSLVEDTIALAGPRIAAARELAARECS